jgi:hypothetical protein
MPALVAGIHDFFTKPKTWMAGTSPAMTDNYATNPQLIQLSAGNAGYR